MTDIALIYDPTSGYYDAQSGALGDVMLDDTLITPVIISLLTERRAQTTDPGADLSNLGGWWGDLPLSTAPVSAGPDYIGSRLHLLRRGLANQQTANRAEGYAKEALAWMIAQGIAQSITCVATWLSITSLQLAVTIIRQVNGQPVSATYNVLWDNTISV